MKYFKLVWLVVAIGLLIPSLSVQGVAPPKEKRVALVIGNGAYIGQNLGKLDNPTHDAEDIAKALKEFGFDVKVHKNLRKAAMDEAIAEFGRRAGDAHAALFYFAGHGVQIKNQNFLIPIDATAKSEATVAYEGINVNYILEELENAHSNINMVMLDACRNNSFTGKFRSGKQRGLAQPGNVPKGTVIVYATDPGNVAEDGDERNGLFTEGLLAGFKAKDSSLIGVLTTASTYVEEKSGGQQTPYVNGPETVKKKFKFRVDGMVEITPVSPSGAASGGSGGQSDRETVFWQSIQGSQDSGDYAAYLQQFPKGMFASLARNRLEKLQGKPQVVAGGMPDDDGNSRQLEMERKAIEAERRKLEDEKRVYKENERKALEEQERQRLDAERKAIEAAKQERKAREDEERKRLDVEKKAIEAERQQLKSASKIKPSSPASERFVDNGNGTITDHKTGLIGLKNANCFGEKDWEGAMSAASSLASGFCGLSDGSKRGDWRLPTKEELPILIEWQKSGVFVGVQSDYYWSSTTYASSTSYAWFVSLSYGYVGTSVKTGTYYVWPVRGGQ